MVFGIGFLVVCVALGIAMEYAPSWVYGAIIAGLEKIMK